jgi:succinoglycan biosynthesis protein ExoA
LKNQLEPFITVIVPTYNEGRYIEACLSSMLDGSYPFEKLQVLVVDGGSEDDTLAVARKCASARPCISVLTNPRKHQAAAFNIGVAHADPRASLILRADAHAVYPPEFIRNCVRSHSEREVAAVVFFQRAKGETCFQKAVAFAWGMPAAVGNSWYRIGTKSRFVNHGLHGCFQRSMLEKVGLYDESMPPNEDAELSTRIRNAGGRIFLDERLSVTYYPRQSVKAFARQQFRYGAGWYRHLRKHRLRPQWRHRFTMAWVICQPLLLIAGFFDTRWFIPVAAYLATLFALSIYAVVRSRSVCTILVGFVIFVLQHAWAFGYLSASLLSARSLKGGERAEIHKPGTKQSR